MATLKRSSTSSKLLIKRMTVNQVLNLAQETLSHISSSRLDSEILLLFVLQKRNVGLNRAWLIAHSDEIISENEEKLFFQLIDRRAKFEPIAYITNKKKFYSGDFFVDKRVLIPRPETEILVEKAIAFICHSRGD